MIFGMIHCGEREVTYTRSTRKVVDSLVNERNVQFDSIWSIKCDSIVERFVENNMDSLLEDRRNEVLRIMEAE
jgi:hypothetical protein